MFIFLRDLFLWIFKKFLFLFFPVIGWIVWFFENYTNVWKDGWDWVFSSIKWFFTDFYLWFFSKLSVMLTTFFNDNDFVVSVVGFSNEMFLGINFFIPLNELCSCVTLIVTTMVSVFVIRIILKGIPTVW